MLSRRGLIFGSAAVAAPAIIRPGLLMPVKRMLLPGIVRHDLTEETFLRALMDAWVYAGRPAPVSLAVQQAFGRT
jgi:hypothetical protein